MTGLPPLVRRQAVRTPQAVRPGQSVLLLAVKAMNPETAALLRQQHTPPPHSSQSCCVLQRRFLAENFPVLRVHCGLCACACSGAAKFFKYFIFARYFGCSPQLGPGMQARLGYHKTTILARADETAWKAKIFVQGSLQVKQLFHLCKWFAH